MDTKSKAPDAGTPEAVNELSEIKDNQSGRFLQLFEKYRVSITEEFHDSETLVVQGDRIVVTRGNIATITGKPKAFKTFLLSGIIAGFMEDETLSISGIGGTCLFIDSEQSKFHVNKVNKRIYNLCGWNTDADNEKLVVLSLRELNAEERLKITLEAIREIHPDLIIIDGIRDLVKDFNDLKESAEIVGQLMTITSQENCGIITVLHQNKADNNARGHLGSELCNKSETVIQVVNTSGIATVSPVYSRNREIQDFSFRIDDASLPVLCDAPKVEKKTGELAELMRKAMFGSAWMNRKTLIEKISTVSDKSEKTAKRRIADAMDSGLIKINAQGFYILVAKNNDNENESEFPF